jgi:hypothetical protein
LCVHRDDPFFFLVAVAAASSSALNNASNASSRAFQAARCVSIQATLTIFLKQTNDTAILATFNYEMNSCSWLTKGDRLALRREAEAIAALATERLAMSACRACGTPASDESLFCRRCGK